MKGQHHDQFFEGLFFPSNITSVLFTLSFSQLHLNHISLPDPESYLYNCTISKEKNCVVNCRTFDLLYSGTWKKVAHGSLHGTLEPEKQYDDLLTLQRCLFGSDSSAAQLYFSTSTVPKETPLKPSSPSYPGSITCSELPSPERQVVCCGVILGRKCCPLNSDPAIILYSSLTEQAIVFKSAV